MAVACLNLQPIDRKIARRFRTGRSWSLKAWLMALVVAASFPLTCYGLVHVLRGYFAQREQMLEATHIMARTIGGLAEQELDRQVMALGILAASPPLVSSDFSAFFPLARSFLEQIQPDGALFAFDAEGRRLFGTDDPAIDGRGHAAISARVFATGVPVLSAVAAHWTTGRATVAIDLPVRREGKIVSELSMVMPLGGWQKILTSLTLPPGWSAAIIDDSGLVAAASPGAGAIAGMPCAAGNSAPRSVRGCGCQDRPSAFRRPERPGRFRACAPLRLVRRRRHAALGGSRPAPALALAAAFSPVRWRSRSPSALRSSSLVGSPVG